MNTVQPSHTRVKTSWHWRMIKFFIWINIGILSIILLSVVGGYVWLHTGLPRYDGRITLAGLNDQVEIIRDHRAIPHIFAKTDGDAYFALGFVHAQDRLWQMESIRRLGAGRLTEIFGTLLGDSFLRIDHTMRTLGLYRLVEISMQTMKPEIRQSAIQYAAGVNAYLSQRRTPLPIEFQLLWHEPEPWQPADSLVWSKIMAMQLSGNFREEMTNLLLRHNLPPETIEDLFPEVIDQFPTTLTSEERSSVLRFVDQIERSFDFLRPVSASNAWVISGSRTETDRPILANDPHLGLSAPVLWYLARIETPEWSVTGATIPGTPFHILGHNGTVAWGMTTNHSDTQDLFIERLADDNPDHYQTPEGSMPFTTREETIGVRWDDDVSVTIRETRHGPVISTIFPDYLTALLESSDRESSNTLLTLQATALSNNDTSAQAIYDLNRAQNWDDFLRAMSRFQTPQQNVFYADTSGTIGFLTSGLVPIRRNGDGRVPVPGWEGTFDWIAVIPFNDWPREMNPSDGLIVNANNPPVSSDYPYLLTARWPIGYRAQRILQHLTQMETSDTVVSSTAIQLDVKSLVAQTLVPIMTAISPPEHPIAAQALTLLKQWDGLMDRNRPEPLIYTEWMRQLYARFFTFSFSRNQRLTIPNWPEVIYHILTGVTRQDWCSWERPVESERCSVELTESLLTAIQVLTEQFGHDPRTWRWGDVHRATLAHPLLSRIPGLSFWFDISIETDGDDHTVNRGTTPLLRSNDMPYSHIHGPGYRAVYDLSNLNRSRFIIATGQSGNPLSLHYQDLVTLWRDGQSIEIPGDLETLKAIETHKLILEPLTR